MTCWPDPIADVQPNLDRIRGMEFSGSMAHEIAIGRKRCTRRCFGPDWLMAGKPLWQKKADRIVTVEPGPTGFEPPNTASVVFDICGEPLTREVSPPVSVGDVIYVREPFRTRPRLDKLSPAKLPAGAEIYRQRKDKITPKGWGRYRHGRFMPRRLSQLTLVVWRVKVRRLQSISADEAFVEGFGWRPRSQLGAFGRWNPSPQERERARQASLNGFRDYWDRLHQAEPKNQFDANPVVAAISFRVLEGNVDDLIAAGEFA
jgi:hypothetical protein